MPSPETLNFEALLTPIPGKNPAGRSLRYTDVYDAIRDARRSDAPVALGDRYGQIKVADWHEVAELTTEALRAESKDLQLAAWLTEALVKLHGFPGLCDGLRLLRELLEQFWETLYPEIEEGDLEAREAPLSWLNDRLPASIHSVPLTKGAEGEALSWLHWQVSRALEKLGHQSQEAMREALADGKITAELFGRAVGGTPRSFYEGLLDDLGQCREECERLTSVVDERCGRDRASLSNVRESIEDCRAIVGDILERKRKLESETAAAPAAESGLLDQLMREAGRSDQRPPKSPGHIGALLKELEDAEGASSAHTVDENVQFTVYRPRAVRPEAWYSLLAFAHLAERRPGADPETLDPVEEVRRQAAQVLAEAAQDYRETTTDSRQGIPREGEITFLADVPEVEFNPPRRTFRWLEDVHREQFRFRAGRELDGKTVRGRLTVFLGTIIVADIPLTLQITSLAGSSAPGHDVQESHAQPYRKIFPSYSHQDLDIVQQCARYAAVLGDRYLQDTVVLRAGELWNDRLMELIREADVFQLFWSRNSMNSPYVRREWEFALALNRPYFVRPTYWEEPLPADRGRNLPPPNLAALHFQRLADASGSPARGGPPAPPAPGRPGTPPSIEAPASTTRMERQGERLPEKSRRSPREILDRARSPRAHIAYDIQTAAATESRELPFVLGVLADLWGTAAEPRPRLRERQFIDVDRDNFDEVVAAMRPRLEFDVEDRLTGRGGALRVGLVFRRLADFEPASLVNQVEAMRQLLEERQRLAARMAESEGSGDDQARADKRAAQARKTEIDRLLSLQLSAIMHAKEFQQLEAAWRGLHLLVSQTETSESLRIQVLSVSKSELSGDLEQAADFDRSVVLRKLYREPYSAFPGTPFGAIVGDYAFGRSSPDVRLLEGVSHIAAAIHAPFIAAASPELLGFESFAELSAPGDLSKTLETEERVRWNRFRELEDSRYVALTVPRILLRPPYGQDNAVEPFDFTEAVDEQDEYLWGNAAFALGARLTEAYARYHWCAMIRGVEGGGLVEGFPCATFKTEEGKQRRPTEIGMTERRERELSDLGLIPLLHLKGTETAVFFSMRTCRKLRADDTEAAPADAHPATQLQHLLTASRFAHHLRALMWNRAQWEMSRTDCQELLQKWISGYVRPDDASIALRARFPLREAQVEVVDVPGKPGVYRAILSLRPEFQLEASSVSVRLAVELPTPARG